MATIVIYTQGTAVTAQSKHIVVKPPQGPKRDIPLISVDRVFCFGKIEVSTRVLQLLAKHQKDLVYFTRRGRYIARLTTEPSQGVDIRRAQYRIESNKNLRLAFGKKSIVGKIQNQINVLKRSWRSGNNQCDKVIDSLNKCKASATNAPSIESLLGSEGSASRIYFEYWAQCCKTEFNWNGRHAHPPIGELNVLLSLSYTLLTNDMHSQCITSGLDPWLGFVHTPGPAKPAMALDLMEPLRPLLIDRMLIDILSHKRITSKNFTKDHEKKLVLDDDAFKKIFTNYERRMQHPVEGISDDGCRDLISTTLKNFKEALLKQNPDRYQAPKVKL